MAKGLFTQCACVLLSGPVSLSDVERGLASFDVGPEIEANEAWAFGGPSVTLGFRPEVNGYVAVDVVTQRWPDHMGDPKKEPEIFGAWATGHFGPFAYPGGLERASQQPWAWEAGPEVAKRHKGFIRVRSSYVFGADEDAPVLPDDYDPVAEVAFVTDVAIAVLGLPQALCYFNPNGEVLRDRAGLQSSLEHAKEHDVPPLDILSNIRLFNLEKGWSFMDTVGNAQLDLPDMESCFAPGYDFGEVDQFLRSVSSFLVQEGEIIKEADTMDGPGGIRWKAAHHEGGTLDPPRRVLRWRPLDDVKMPKKLVPW